MKILSKVSLMAINGGYNAYIYCLPFPIEVLLPKKRKPILPSTPRPDPSPNIDNIILTV